MSDCGSGSTTNPNTPRSPEVEEAMPRSPEVDEVDSSLKTTTTSSGRSDHDLHPTWPRSFDVVDVPAMATWGLPNQPIGDTSLGNLWFELHWDLRAHVAFFKLHASHQVAKKKIRGRGGRAVYYIYIHPERIRELSLDTNPTTQPFGADTLLLKFVLDRPPALVMSKTIGYDAANSKKLLDSCKRMASQTSFQLHVDVSEKSISVEQLQRLCAAACDTGLSSSEQHARITQLYHGKGGRVVEGETLQSPPLYNESAAPEPAATHGGPVGTKRRRLHSPQPESSPLAPTPPPGLEAMRALLDSSLASFKKDLKCELRQELKQDFDDAFAAHKVDVANKLHTAEARIVDVVRSEFGDHWNDVEQAMMDRVRQGMAEAQEEIMENISEQQVTATFTFNNHPLY